MKLLPDNEHHRQPKLKGEPESTFFKLTILLALALISLFLILKMH